MARHSNQITHSCRNYPVAIRDLNMIISPNLNDRFDPQLQVKGRDCIFLNSGLEKAITSRIKRHSYLFGCVAWLSNTKILDAMHGKQGCIVVQSEDFKSYLLGKYRDLAKGGLYIKQFGTPSMDFCRNGVDNFDRPILHHKFMLFGDGARAEDMKSLWIGSFNFTAHATQNLESAVVISGSKKKQHPAIASAFKVVQETALCHLTQPI